MGLYLNQEQSRTQLSSRVAADLSRRLGNRAIENDAKNAAILQNQRKTTGGGLFWTIIITAVVLALLVYVMFIL